MSDRPDYALIDQLEVECDIAGRGIEKYLASGEAIIDPRSMRVLHQRPRD